MQLAFSMEINYEIKEVLPKDQQDLLLCNICLQLVPEADEVFCCHILSYSSSM